MGSRNKPRPTTSQHPMKKHATSSENPCKEERVFQDVNMIKEESMEELVQPKKR